MNQPILTSTFIRFRDRLRRVAAGIVGNEEEAEDVIQDAFCRLWSRHPEVETEIHAIRLSVTTVKNSAIDALRRSNAHPNVAIETLSPGAEPTADDSSEAEERERTYEAVISLSRKVLTERQYEVFHLHDIEGIGYAEIAERIDATPEYVRVTLSRARKTIREIYRKQYIS